MQIRRDQSLDGLRGIAALAVVFSHIAALKWVPFVDGPSAPNRITYMLWHLGAPAVDLFFVLSGYVICASLIRRPTDYVSFAISRAIRLLPIAWCGVMAGLLLRYHADYLPLGLSAAFSDLQKPLTGLDVIGFASMLAPVPKTAVLNPPLWTMFIEMQASMAMPLLALAMGRRPLFGGLATVAILIASAILLRTSNPLLFCGFVIGGAYAGLEHKIPDAPNPRILLAVSLAILLLRTWIGSDDEIFRPVCALAALGVLIAVRDGAVRSFLDHPIIQGLGKISYPLYAVHFPILGFGVIAGTNILGITAAGLTAIPLAIASALLLQIAVDRPSIALSKIAKNSFSV